MFVSAIKSLFLDSAAGLLVTFSSCFAKSENPEVEYLVENGQNNTLLLQHYVIRYKIHLMTNYSYNDVDHCVIAAKVSGISLNS